MRAGPDGLYRIGGAAFIASGLLLLARAVLDYQAGAPPADGTQILAWIVAHSLILKLDSEILFFAAASLVPAVAALYLSLAARDRTKAVVGCGLLAAASSVLMLSLIVHGRLVYPVYGIRASTPEMAALVVALFYGGMHAVFLLLAIATLVLSWAMVSGPHGKPVAYVGFAATVCDIAAAYPDLIGATLTVAVQLVVVAWFVVLGTRLYHLSADATA